MRPRGEVRQALSAAAWDLYTEQQRGVHWREAASRAQVGWGRAKQTMRDMEAAGELRRLPERARVPGAARPMVLYVPTAAERTPQPQALQSLDSLTRAWCSSTPGAR